MSQEKMSIFGIGPKLAILTIIYTVIMYFITKMTGEMFVIKQIPDSVIYVTCFLLLLIGIPFFITSVKTLLKGFPNGKLMIRGVYSIVRNPLYSSFICFIVPALVILTKSILVITTPVFMYFLFKILIKKEEEYLEQTFKQDFIEYKSKVCSVIPIKRFLKGIKYEQI